MLFAAIIIYALGWVTTVLMWRKVDAIEDMETRWAEGYLLVAWWTIPFIGAYMAVHDRITDWRNREKIEPEDFGEEWTPDDTDDTTDYSLPEAEWPEYKGDEDARGLTTYHETLEDAIAQVTADEREHRNQILAEKRRAAFRDDN